MDDIYHIQTHTAANQIDKAIWDRYANGEGRIFNPFAAHDFFTSLEDSGSAIADTGWGAQHLTLETQRGDILGIMPLYLKGHSRGEYVFDHAWAEAYMRAGGDYYPKLLSSVPFTPVTGPRIFVENNAPKLKALLAKGAITLMQQQQISTCHITFLDQETLDAIEPIGFLKRQDNQFHWHNNGYQKFDDFLAMLSSRKRKSIQTERRKALAGDITIEWLTGKDIKERHWNAFYNFYLDTSHRKWGQPYLTRLFFSLIAETMSPHILLMLCKRSDNFIAGALHFIGRNSLYGRYWGESEHHKFLHFETCYYQAMDYAIEQGLKFVEAGAQGPHKLARGYVPSTTLSAHYIADPLFRNAIEGFLSGEDAMQSLYLPELTDKLPFKKI